MQLSEALLCTHSTLAHIAAPLSSAVVLTHDIIHSLRGQPVPLAARAVGVSAISFKRACRRLGVGRWEHTRGLARAPRKRRGAVPSGDPAASPGQVDPDCCIPPNSIEEETGVSLDLLVLEGRDQAAVGMGMGQADDALVLELLALPWQANAIFDLRKRRFFWNRWVEVSQQHL